MPRAPPLYKENVDALVESLHDSYSILSSVEMIKVSTEQEKGKRLTPTDSTSKKKWSLLSPQPPQPPKIYSANYINQVPKAFRPHVINMVDVIDDGNCGFRSIAALMEMGEDSWPIVRQSMIHELQNNYSLYTTLYETNKLYQTVFQALQVSPKEIVTRKKWLSIPNMGYLVSTTFNVVFVTLSHNGCSTFFPLTGPPPHLTDHKLIAILHVNNNHWVQVHLKKEFPMPAIAPKWHAYCAPSALPWKTPYSDRISQYQDIIAQQNSMKTLEVIDLTND